MVQLTCLQTFLEVLVCARISDRQEMSCGEPIDQWARQGMSPVSLMQAGHSQGPQRGQTSRWVCSEPPGTSSIWDISEGVSEVVIFVTQRRIGLEEDGGETLQGW